MQANRRDLCGQRFGKLTVIRRVEGTQSNRARADSWLCRCDCGNESVVLGSNLVRGHTKSCGCIKLNDLTGQHIGSLTVLGRSDKYATRGKRRVRLWECKCDCGAITYPPSIWRHIPRENLRIWRNICTGRKCMVQIRRLLSPF